MSPNGGGCWIVFLLLLAHAATNQYYYHQGEFRAGVKRWRGGRADEFRGVKTYMGGGGGRVIKGVDHAG